MDSIAKLENQPIERASQVCLLTPRFNPDEMLEAHDAMRQWVEGALVKKRDYDTLSGTEKNIILKPGIDRIIKGFQLTASCVIVSEEVDHDRVNTYDAGKWLTLPDPGRAEKDRLKTNFPGKFRNRKNSSGNWEWQEKVEEVGTSYGLYRYVVKCKLYDPNGIFVGDATGICSSMESRYIRNPRDAEHTIYAMAAKRARSAAVISVLGLSDIFDVEDEAPSTPMVPTPTQAEREEAIDTGSQPTTIKGLVVVLREWDLNPVKEKDLKTLCLDRGLKLVDAIAEAQRTGGPSAIASLDAFLDWLGKVHPAADPVQEEQQ